MTPPLYTYAARVIRVIDGDTIVADLDLGFRLTIRVHVRVADWSAPELDSQEGPIWRDGLAAALRGRSVVVQTTGRASFERWVGSLWANGERVLASTVLEHVAAQRRADAG